MSIFGAFFGSGMKDPEYFRELGECDGDCLSCPHLDFDCEGDEMEDEELFHELYDDDEEW